MSVGSHRTGDLADADPGARAAHPLDVTVDLSVPQRQLQPEGRRLGVHPVCPANHRRSAMFERLMANGGGQPVEVLEDEIAGLAHLKGLRGVDDVRRRHPKMQPACGRPDFFSHGRRERDDVVLGDLFDFVDARDVERAAFTDVACGLGRHDADLGSPWPRQRRLRRAARFRTGAGRSRCAPFQGACSVQSFLVEIEPFPRQL